MTNSISKAKFNAFEDMTERIIAQLEQGVVPWRQPWSSLGITACNYTSKRAYRGINWMLLNAVPQEPRYYITANQAKKLKGRVKEGEYGKTQNIFFYKVGKYEKDGEEKKSFMMRAYRVYHISQIEGIDWKIPEPPKIDFAPIDLCERVIAETQLTAPIFDGGRAAYHPLGHKIEMPPREHFKTEQRYYATLFHEMGHATGTPLQRDFGGGFGSQKYAKEELIAELTSAYLCSACRIDNDVFDQSASYIDGWLKAIKSADSKFLYQSASAAQKAADYLLEGIDLPTMQNATPSHAVKVPAPKEDPAQLSLF